MQPNPRAWATRATGARHPRARGSSPDRRRPRPLRRARHPLADLAALARVRGRRVHPRRLRSQHPSRVQTARWSHPGRLRPRDNLRSSKLQNCAHKKSDCSGRCEPASACVCTLCAICTVIRRLNIICYRRMAARWWQVDQLAQDQSITISKILKKLDSVF